MPMLTVAQRQRATCSAANIGHDSLPTLGCLRVAVSKLEKLCTPSPARQGSSVSALLKMRAACKP